MNRRSPREHRGRRKDKRGKQYGSRHSREHRFLLTENYFSFRIVRRDILPGFFFVPSGVKEETHQPETAGEADRHGQDLEHLLWKHFLESMRKDGFSRRQHHRCQHQSGYDSGKAEFEGGRLLAHRFSPAKTSRPRSKPCCSKASARLRLSNGSLV